MMRLLLFQCLSEVCVGVVHVVSFTAQLNAYLLYNIVSSVHSPIALSLIINMSIQVNGWGPI